MKRTCRQCGSALGWKVRGDAIYCSAKCKQIAYRRRSKAGLPVEIWRLHWSEYYVDEFRTLLTWLPLEDRRSPVLVVAYARTTYCVACDEPISDDTSDDGVAAEDVSPGLLLVRGNQEFGPFCEFECLVDAAHTPWLNTR